jgi:hypothetical protein
MRGVGVAIIAGNFQDLLHISRYLLNGCNLIGGDFFTCIF